MVTQDGNTLVIAVLGLGEAGSVIARDLIAAGALDPGSAAGALDRGSAAGVLVRGYDPAVAAAEPVIDTGSEAEAARGAHLVLSVNSAKAAVDAFRAGLPACASQARTETSCGPT